jgi:CHASE3 domain sensor protein
LKSLNNLNIGGKLNLGFGLLVALTLIVVLLGIVGGWQATVRIDLIESLRLPTAQVSARAQASLLEMLTNVRSYLVLGNTQYRQNYHQAKSEFEASLAQLEALSVNWEPENIERLEELKTTFAEWSELPTRLFRLHDNPGENQLALPLVSLEFKPQVNMILSQLDDLIEAQKQQPPTVESRELLVDMFDFQASR